MEVNSIINSTVEEVLAIKAQQQKSFIAKIVGFVPYLLFKIVSFATISIPVFCYRILTWSFTLHLNFTTLLVIIAIILTITYLVVRYRFLTKYSRLKPINTPAKVTTSFDLHPDTSGDDYADYSQSAAYKNYPDEFLSAFLSSIKIFGYLEQPVFHELARHLQTKKLLAGDTLFRNPEQERSFYIVVDGNVQMFVKPDNDVEEEESDDSDLDEPWQNQDQRRDRFSNYTLINEVGAGGTLSSLFTILSVFKESFNRSEAKQKQRQRSTTSTTRSNLSKVTSLTSDSPTNMSREASAEGWNQVFPALDNPRPEPSMSSSSVKRRRSKTTQPLSPSDFEDTIYFSGEMSNNEPLPLRKLSDFQHPYQQRRFTKPKLHLHTYRSVHPNIIARATVDTTLAVIPEEAFHKLAQKFPKSAAHIVHVIVTRFQRVTLMTSHRYLGLTSELLSIEKQVVESTSLQKLPPNFFTPGGMDRLRHKFNEETSSQEGEPSRLNRKESTEIIEAIGIIDIPGTPSLHGSSSNIAGASPTTTKGGSPNLLPHNLNRRGEYSVEDDEHIRTSVLQCMSDILGIQLEDSSTRSGGIEEGSTQYLSPRTSRRNTHYPMDLFSHTGAMDSSTSPSLDPLDGSYDDDFDTYSTTSSIQSGSDIFNVKINSDAISPDDVQILYFPQDAVLVKEGAHNNGLFFVIDGYLEVSMNSSVGEDKSESKTSRKPLNRQRSRIVDNGFRLAPSTQDQQQKSTAKDTVIASEAPAGRTHRDRKFCDGHEKEKKPIFTIKPGHLAGYLGALTGSPSFVEIKAKTNCYVGYVSKKRLDRIIEKNPAVMLKLAHQLVSHVSPLILHIDISLEWMQIGSGQIICREGEPSDNIYMVLHGRLRTIHEKKDGEIEILGEFGRGDSVGELEVLTGIPTSATLHAIRDTELARMPKTLFNALALRHPEITLQISRMVALRSLQLAHLPGSQLKSDDLSSISNNQFPELYGRNNVNLKSIGIIPVNASVPITEFAESLKSELIHSVGATCALLNGATVTRIMGKYAFTRLGKLKLASWLADQEEKYRIVLYLADSGVTSQWTRTCIRQADCILLVGLGEGDPSVGEYERFLINMKTTARKELVLLHGERFCASGTTQNWLKNRLWIQAHHHIFMPMKQHATEKFRPPWLAEQGRKMTAGSINMLANMKDQLNNVVPNFSRILDVKKPSSSTMAAASSPTRNDFARLARRLCGKSVALVLGGGGARGIAHVGIIQAIEEAGIPIDIIGGTSIGSFVGGLYARNMDLVSVMARTKFFAGRVSSIWRTLMDLTYPVTAWFTGHEFNRAIWKCLGDSQIEDYWLPYYAVTTNITFSRMEVHTTGYGWRYIRASMSLSGYMPPICENGNMLVDGGYMDNLPVSVAKSMGADIIIAVDVASEDDTSPVYYGDSVSGWWALLHGFNPFRTYNIPSIADIQSRLAYVSSVVKLEEAKLTNGTLYIKLPVQQFGTLEFSKYNSIFQKGYDSGRQVITKWKKAGYVSGRITDSDPNSNLTGKEVKGKRGRRNSI